MSDSDTHQPTINQHFNVDVRYKVHFTQNIFSSGNEVFEQSVALDKTAFICIIDEGVSSTNPVLVSQIEQFFSNLDSAHLLTSPIIITGGETCKNSQKYLTQLYQAFLTYGVDRHNCVLAIGGGALLDLVGYAAATAHRGMRLIRMPTTVLSQNDSGVGVKNGINLFDRKNFLGTFTPPETVICDFDFLSTLPPREKMAGMAEAIKVSLIRDQKFFNWLEQNCAALYEFKMDEVAYSIQRCAQLHATQISTGGDPFEKGSARPLDYGHWLAHKLEVMSDYKVRHGEAVAIGMMVDAHYSYLKGLLSDDSLNRIKKLISGLGFALWHELLEKTDDNNELIILQGLEEFREHLGGELSITLLDSIGTGIEVNEIDNTLMKSSLAWVKDCNEIK